MISEVLASYIFEFGEITMPIIKMYRNKIRRNSNKEIYWFNMYTGQEYYQTFPSCFSFLIRNGHLEINDNIIWAFLKFSTLIFSSCGIKAQLDKTLREWPFFLKNYQIFPYGNQRTNIIWMLSKILFDF